MGIEQVLAKAMEMLWVGGLTAIPMAMAVGAICRWRGVRPATRHMLWVAVLASFLTPAVASFVWRPHWFRSDRMMAAADSVLGQKDTSDVPAPALFPQLATASDKGPAATMPPVPGFDHERTLTPGGAPTGALSGPPTPSPAFAPSGSQSPSLSGRPSVITRGPSAVGIIFRTSPAREIQAPLPTPHPIVHNFPIERGVSAAPSGPPTPLPAAASFAEFVGPPLPIAELGIESQAQFAPPAATIKDEPKASPFVNERFVGALLTALNDGATVGAGVDTAAPQFSQAPMNLPPSPATPIAQAGGVRAWLIRILALRDALADLHPVPLSVWLGGALFVITLSLWRRSLAMMWLGRAVPASPQVLDVVRQVGDTLGLARTPRVVFVDAAISPMIWCGLRPLLVLPLPLWRTLDGDSRKAVIVHELAHVRRWDHILCWLEALVGVVYWWHPVVWWARRRLHEEAEASCDAWVTALFPSARRAYASALVVTTSYVSSRAESRGPWLGVASGSAKRLARRITMVMTHKSAPKVSLMGVCAAALVIATGAFVMPGLACPPVEDEAKAKTVHVHGTLSAAAPAAAPISDEPGAAFFGEAPALEAMKGRGRGPSVAPIPPTPPSAPTPFSAPTPVRAPKAPKPPATPMVWTVPQQGVQPAEPPTMTLDLEALKEGRTPREYQLSPGKLEAFYGMMSRGDVPILVQMQGDHIIIWGDESEHAVFAKFVKIVDGKSRKTPRALKIEGGQLSGLSQIDVERLAPALKAGQLATAIGAEKAVAEEYKTQLRSLTRGRDSAQQAAERARAEADVVRAHASELREQAQTGQQRRREAENMVSALRLRSETLENDSRSVEQRVRDLERLILELEQRAQRIEEQGAAQHGTIRAKKAGGSPGMLSPGSTGEGSSCDKACEEKQD